MILKMTKLMEIKEIMLCKFLSNHVTGGHAQGGGKTFWYTHFGGAKALFSYINLQVTDPVGGYNHAKF